MDKRQFIRRAMDERKSAMIEINDAIWGYAETKFEEVQSSSLQREYMEKEGFEIQRQIGGMKTAFVARFGSGTPVIAMLGEFDALPELSQRADRTLPEAEILAGNGHGCGHNSLGTAAMMAAVGVKAYLQETGREGTICYYGCPAEESGAGKTFMVREGCFEGVDIALTWHPHYLNAIVKSGSLANVRVYYKFNGISAHAAAEPHLGRSALDAVELMNVGVNYLREHIIPEARVHYAITNTGGSAPNVVQKEAEVLYAIRAPKLKQVKEILERVNKIAAGAAMMTETTVEKRQTSGYANYICNPVVAAVLEKHICENYNNSFTEEEVAYAAEYKKTIAEDHLRSFLDTMALRESERETYAADLLQNAVSQAIYPPLAMIGSTDVGDVSWNVPTAQFYMACYAIGTPSHSWQLTAQGRSCLVHKALPAVSTILAMSAIDFLEDRELVAQAKRELDKELDMERYVCPIPKEVQPEA